MSGEVRYANLTPADFERRLAEAPVAYLPLGTLEWHGPHLPLGSDGLQSESFFTALAGRAGGIVLPMLFLGPDIAAETADGTFYGMDIYGFPDGSPGRLPGSAYRIDDGLFSAVLANTLFLLRRAGFEVVVAHGHGPSTHYFRAHRAAWEAEYGLKLLDCWREDETDGMGLMTDHAASNETSAMLHFHRDLVRMEALPAGADEKPLAVSGEDPRFHASSERGRRAVTQNLERMEKLVRSALGRT